MSSATRVGPAIDAFAASVSQYARVAAAPEALAAAAVDGVVPALIVNPPDSDALRRILSEAQTHGLAVIPVGSGQHRALGNTPRRYDVALSLQALSAVVDHEPADMTVTVQAGAPLASVQAVLAKHGQFLPLDPPGAASATIGGIVAANAFGPSRHAFGTARDWLIGTRVAHADGSESKSGGRVVKNVAGYDMHKLYVGSVGTLGIIIQMTFKVAPLPHARRVCALAIGDAAMAGRIALAARDRGLALHALELLSPTAAHRIGAGSTWTLLFLVGGGGRAVDRTLREIDSLGRSCGASMAEPGEAAWDAWSDAFSPGAVALRLSAAPSETATLVERLDRRYAGDGARISATIAAGVTRVRFDDIPAARGPALVTIAREVAARHHGTCVIEAAPPAIKAAAGDVFGPRRDDFVIMRRLKDALDPGGVLSPGRFIGGI